MKKIQGFSPKQLRTEEDFGFHKMVVVETELLTAGTDSPEGISLMAAGTVSPLVTAAITAYKAAYAAFDSALKESNSVPSASTASDADGTRDEAWRGYIYQDTPTEMRVLQGDKERYQTAPALPAPYDDSFRFLRSAVRGEIEVPATDLSSLENNLVVMRILDAAIRSAREKRVIPLDN